MLFGRQQRRLRALIQAPIYGAYSRGTCRSLLLLPPLPLPLLRRLRRRRQRLFATEGNALLIDPQNKTHTPGTTGAAAAAAYTRSSPPPPPPGLPRSACRQTKAIASARAAVGAATEAGATPWCLREMRNKNKNKEENTNTKNTKNKNEKKNEKKNKNETLQMEDRSVLNSPGASRASRQTSVGRQRRGSKRSMDGGGGAMTTSV